MTQVVQIKLKVSNAYLLIGKRPILIDTGSPHEQDKIIQVMRGYDIRPEDLSLVVHTHVHSDHVGSTAALKELSKAPIAYHLADQPLMEQGHNGALRGTSIHGFVLAYFFQNQPFESVVADVALSDGLSLLPFGIHGRVVHTPGHTAGSVSILLDSGDAIIGDMLMGGFLGGELMSERPRWHYFAENLNTVKNSLAKIMAFSPQRLFVGHGGPLTAQAVQAFRKP